MAHSNKVVLLYWQQCRACTIFRPQFHASVVPKLPPGVSVEELEFWKDRAAVLAHAGDSENLSFPTVILYDASGQKHVVPDDPLTPQSVYRDVRAVFSRKWDFGSTHPAAIHSVPSTGEGAVSGGAQDKFAPYAVTSLSSIHAPSLVLYYKPECKYCSTFFPTFQKLSEDLHGVNVVAVNVNTHRGVLRTLHESVRSGAVPHLVATPATGNAQAFPQATPRTFDRVKAFVDAVFVPSAQRSPKKPGQKAAPHAQHESESEDEQSSSFSREESSQTASDATSDNDEAWSRTIKFTATSDGTAVRDRLQQALHALQTEARKAVGRAHGSLFSPAHAAVCGVAWKRARAPVDDVLFVMLIPQRAPAAGAFPIFATLEGAPCSKKGSFTLTVHNAPKSNTQTDPTRLLKRREFETALESNVAVQALRGLGYPVRVAGGYTLAPC